MPPIPVYSDAPIIAQKPDGVTPRSADAPTNPLNEPTRTTNDTSSYPAARPGQAAVPAPTSAVPKPGPQPSRTITEIRQVNGPALPQPGAVPVAPTQSTSNAQSSDPHGPSPSRPDPNNAPPSTITQMPSQFSIPPPSSSSLPTHSTDPTSATSRTTSGGPTVLPLGDVPQVPPPQSQYSLREAGRPSSEQPNAYRQNPYAAEMNAAQRAQLEALEENERHERKSSLTGILGGSNSGGAGFGASGIGSEEGVWGSVKALAGIVSDKAVELEEEVWRRVNGEGK